MRVITCHVKTVYRKPGTNIINDKKTEGKMGNGLWSNFISLYYAYISFFIKRTYNYKTLSSWGSGRQSSWDLTGRPVKWGYNLDGLLSCPYSISCLLIELNQYHIRRFCHFCKSSSNPSASLYRYWFETLSIGKINAGWSILRGLHSSACGRTSYPVVNSGAVLSADQL